ncbi:ESF1 homolog [Xenia sp. Carnegie-2017]|uniref:ESF1 homolog n=1 Tax=Xenia sp. Carnegie-2017 TaxID=2897299 RepID=UPI001F03B5D0|nr:ESF1 homolog [Xenia sp. Carnegie-2017]
MMDIDERFSHIKKDPRFRIIPNKKKKVKIDSRFQQMFNDEDFNTKYFVDKRGRKVKESASEDLSKFYEISDEDEQIVKPCSGDLESRDSEKFSEVIPEDKTKQKNNARRKHSVEVKENGKSKKIHKNETKNKNMTLSPTEHEVMKSFQNQTNDNWHDFDANVPMTEEATRRLAVCNMNWDKITVDDLYVLLHSFVPSGGSILSVKIYPSDFGLERMEREDEIGPMELVAEREDHDEASEHDQVLEEEFDEDELRRYQINRLKYFYAVVECDAPETAEKIYEECNGLEYEASSSLVDLRFIPDHMTFERKPTSQATEMPSIESYKPSEFITTALQQSTVRLTWDETDPRRVQTTMRNFSKDDLLDIDFKAYLASSSDDDSARASEESGDEEEDKKIAKYKEILGEIKKKEEPEEKEMEITWDVGLKASAEELVKRIKDETSRKELTPWESYLKTRKNKKRKKQQEKLKENNDDDELPADVDLSDPFFAEERTGTVGIIKELSSNVCVSTNPSFPIKAELQLLMMDDDDDREHFNLKSIMKNEKSRKKRKQKTEENMKDNFEINVNDSRFSALYSSHLFAVDPSDPQFKKTKAMDSIIREKQRRSENKNNEMNTNRIEKKKIQNCDEKRLVDPGLTALIKSVKSKAGKCKGKRGNEHMKIAIDHDGCITIQCSKSSFHLCRLTMYVWK